MKIIIKDYLLLQEINEFHAKIYSKHLNKDVTESFIFEINDKSNFEIEICFKNLDLEEIIKDLYIAISLIKEDDFILDSSKIKKPIKNKFFPNLLKKIHSYAYLNLTENIQMGILKEGKYSNFKINLYLVKECKDQYFNGCIIFLILNFNSINKNKIHFLFFF